MKYARDDIQIRMVGNLPYPVLDGKVCPECGGYDGDHDEDCDNDKVE